MKYETDIPQVKLFANWATENIEKFLISEGHCYSEALWVGGITDCMAEMKNGEVWIIDFKSSPVAYDSQFVQVAGYDLEQAENGIFDADGKNMLAPQEIKKYAIVPFGAKEFKVEIKEATNEFREGFKSAACLYKLLNKN